MKDKFEKFNFDELIKKGQREFNLKNYHEASFYFQKAYQKKQNFELNKILTGTLYEDQQFSLAETYLEDFINGYLNNKKLFNLALKILLKNQSFINAYEMVISASSSFRNDGLRIIRDEEDNFRRKMPLTKKILTQSFYHLSDGDFGVQRDRFESSLKLPLYEWWHGTKFLFLDPYINPLIRATLIETSQKLRINEEVNYYWINNKIYKLNPAHISSLFSDKTYLELKKILSNEIGAKDPVANESLGSTLRMQASLFFPKIKDGIFEKQYWIDEIVNQYNGIKGMSRMSSKQKNFFNKVNNLIKNIIRYENTNK